MKTTNSEPDEDYDEGTITLTSQTWNEVKKMIDAFIKETEKED